jgi:hypothetical protein
VTPTSSAPPTTKPPTQPATSPHPTRSQQ